MPAYFYMITFLALIVVWIFLDMQANIWDDETAKHKAELEECDKKITANENKLAGGAI